jgi:predicted acetylornithine/succinylornithine family transaminase
MNSQDIEKREATHFLPVVNRLPVTAVEGRGARIIDVDGNEYVDLTAGWGVTCIGHCHPTLVKAIADQSGQLMQTTNMFYNLPQLDLIERLAEVSPQAITRSFIVSSGTEAVEGALKLAHRATGRPNFVSTEDSFHGRTLGALRVIGQAKHRAPYEQLMLPAKVVPYNDLAAMRAAVTDDVAAIIVEPIQGEGGVNVPSDGYLTGLREICDASGALLILDEVQTCMGRTGTMLALEHDGVSPDVITLGKGLGGGFPVAAFLTTDEVAQTVNIGDHGATYGGNPVACAAANAVLRVLHEDKLVERSATLGAQLNERLKSFAEQNPDLVLEVRGRGLLQGLVLRDAEYAPTIPLAATKRGVLVNVAAGNVVRFFPALSIPEDELFSAVDTVLELVTAARK